MNKHIEQEHSILVVDDEAALLNSIQDLMLQLGYKVDAALGGKSAIESLKNKYYDLIILDLNMPIIDGHEVMRFLSNNNIKSAIIVISGQSNFSDLQKTLRHGVNDYLRKPYTISELANSVEQSLRQIQSEKDSEKIQYSLKRSEWLHRFIVNNSTDIIFILDKDHRFNFLNQRVEDLLSYTPKELYGRPITDILIHDDEKTCYFFDQEKSPENETITLELALQPNHNRSPKHFEVTLCVAEDFNDTDNNANNIYYYGNARDITERIEAEAFINFQAYHDLLTRLPNRALFKDRLNNAIQHAQRNSEKIAVMFIDLDRFKVINDSMGHTMGDRLLQAVAQRLQKTIRKSDTLSRFGGDEFTLLLPNVQNEAAAIQITEKILDAVKKPFAIAGHELYIGASIGIAIYPDAGEEIDTLIRNADIAMYRVKNSGKNSYQVYRSEMSAASQERMILEQDMRKSLDDGDFYIEFQPQIDLKTNDVCGMEALLRWNHKELGYIEPKDFIPIAEETRLITQLDKYALKMACHLALPYFNNDENRKRLAVNISPILLEHHDAAETIISILDDANFPAGLLEIEITENILLNDKPETIETLTKLNTHGISLAVDDFGTGYSSLSYLHKYPISILKIDRSFVNNIETYDNNSCMVNAIIAMAKGLNMKIVAEGVEERSQLEYLKNLGCDIAQGFLISKPTDITNIYSNTHCLLKKTAKLDERSRFIERAKSVS